MGVVKAGPLGAVLANAFSLSMLPLEPGERARLCVARMDFETWKHNVLLGPVECAIGHESTARLVEELLGVRLNCRRATVELGPGGVVYVVQLKFRPPEGKIYNYNELKRLLDEGKLAFYAVYYDSPMICGDIPAKKR